MTYDEIQDEIVNIRFGETHRSYVRNWINTRYAWIWAAGDWHFKKVHNEDLAVTAADQTPTMPSAYNRTLRVWDDNGSELTYHTPENFGLLYSDLTATGRPDAYTVVNRQMYLADIPDASYTFKHSYERGVCHLADGSTVTSGFMNTDNDTPVWPAEHHYLLVVGGMATGLKLKNDPTWPAIEEEFTSLLAAMKDDLLPPDRAVPVQFDRDAL